VVKGGKDPKVFMDNLLKTSRDHARTPMLWENAPNGGFTTGRPWLPVNKNYNTVNARQAVNDPNSIYHHYRQLMELRRQTPALIYGDYADLDPDHAQVFAYTRTLSDERYLVLLNCARSAITYKIPQNIMAGSQLIGNLKGKEEFTNRVNLGAWEARIYRI
jgi:oligo-1,6-glucosidase